MKKLFIAILFIILATPAYSAILFEHSFDGDADWNCVEGDIYDLPHDTDSNFHSRGACCVDLGSGRWSNQVKTGGKVGKGHYNYMQGWLTDETCGTLKATWGGQPNEIYVRFYINLETGLQITGSTGSWYQKHGRFSTQYNETIYTSFQDGGNLQNSQYVIHRASTINDWTRKFNTGIYASQLYDGWHCIEFRIKLKGGGEDEVEAWLDGNQTAIDTNMGLTNYANSYFVGSYGHSFGFGNQNGHQQDDTYPYQATPKYAAFDEYVVSTNYIGLISDGEDVTPPVVTITDPTPEDITADTDDIAWTFTDNVSSSAAECRNIIIPDGDRKLATGPLEQVVGKNYFRDSLTGKYVYLAGSHTWDSVQFNGGENPPLGIYGGTVSYSEWVAMLQAAGHNYQRLWVWEGSKGGQSGTEGRTAPQIYARSGVGTAYDGGTLFDLDTFNQTYFDLLENNISEAEDAGIYVSVMLFQGWSITKDYENTSYTPWIGHPFNLTNNNNSIDGDFFDSNGEGEEFHSVAPGTYSGADEVSAGVIWQYQKDYIDKVIATVDGYDNVIYEVANEDPGHDATWAARMKLWQQAVVDYVQLQTTKPIGITTSFKMGNDFAWTSNAEWMSPSAFVSQTECIDDIYLDPPIPSHDQIEIIDTDHIFGIGGDVEWIWKVFLRGYNLAYMDSGAPGTDNVGTCGNPESYDLVRANVGYTVKYGNKIDLANMVPSNSISSSTYALYDVGEEYLSYFNGSSGTITITAGDYRVEYFDPRDGSTSNEDKVYTSTSAKTFTRPSHASTDFVVWVKKYQVDTTSPATVTGFRQLDNTVKVLCEDDAGNEGSDTVVRTYYAVTTPPPPLITLTAPDAAASESGDTGTFRFTRSSTVGDTTTTVNYSISGTASADDYTPTLSGTVDITGTNLYTDVIITPTNNSDTEDEYLTLTVIDDGYYISNPYYATITITDITGTTFPPGDDMGENSDADLTGGVDTTITVSSPDRNEVDYDHINVGYDYGGAYERRMIFYYDISYYTGRTITAAELCLWQNGGAGSLDSVNFSVHRISGVAPDLYGATWNTYDGSTAWTNNSAGDDDIETAEDTIGVDGGPGWNCWTVTNAADWAVDSNGSNLYLMIKPATTTVARRYFNANDDVDLYRPRLFIVSSGAPSATVLSSEEPYDGEIDVYPTRTISFTLNNDSTPIGVETITIDLDTTEYVCADSEVTCVNPSGNIWNVELVPATNLTYNHEYTVTVDAQNLTTFVWNFTTVKPSASFQRVNLHWGKLYN